MASTVVACVDSALDIVVKLLKKARSSDHDHGVLKILRFKLRNIKTFVLCAQKLQKDGRLESFLERIGDTVSRNGWKFDDGYNYLNGVQGEIESLEEEIDEWYATLFDYTPRQSTCFTTHQVLETVSSILENLVDMYDFRSTDFHFEVLGQALEALREQLSFLKSLLFFVLQRTGVDMEDLLAHSEAVAMNAAYLLFTCKVDKFDEEKRRGVQLKISSLLQKIKPISPHVYQTYSQVLCRSKLSRPLVADSDADADAGADAVIGMKLFLDSLVSNLWEILQFNTTNCMEYELQELYEGLRSLRTILVLKQQQQPNDFDIGAVLCDAGVFICSLYLQTHPPLGLQSLLGTIKIVLGVTDPIFKVNEVTTPFSQVGPSQRISTTTDDIVGFQEEARSIVNILLQESKKLQMVVIVGIQGSGKTALATKVYNDPSIRHYFRTRACCHVSKVLNRREMLLDLLNEIDPEQSRSEYTDEQDLMQILWRCLKRRRYFICLDDVWDIEAWEALKMSFPDDAVGSRILLTSRFHNVGPLSMLGGEPHLILQFSRQEAMDLLQNKLFPGHDWPSSLQDLRMQIVDICKGLPLKIVLIADLLATTEQDRWKEILEAHSSFDLEFELELENWERSLGMSDLPDDERKYLLYFATFPKHQEVSARRLYRLWIAEGFVQQDLTKSQDLEEIAESYLQDFIRRGFVRVAERRSYGGVKTCRINGYVHDFCIRKAKRENFLHILNGYDELLAFNEQPSLWRLSIDSKPEHFKESKLFCPRARSLLFKRSEETKSDQGEEFLLDVSFVIHTFKLVTVLDLEHINIGSVLPSEIELLVHLAFLAIRGKLRRIPSSIAKLSNLETFIVDSGTEILSLPDNLLELWKLSYLSIRSSHASGGASFPKNFLDEDSSVSQGLNKFSGAVIPSWGNMEKLLRKFPKLRKLKCRQGKDETENLDKSVVLDHVLSQLESLHLSSFDGILFEFSFPLNLRKLTLSGFHLHSTKFSTIGGMPNLEVLKLLDVSFPGKTWEMKEGEFLKLRFLKLYSSGLVRWRSASGDAQCCRWLEKLVLYGCQHLEEMPSFLENPYELGMVELRDCSVAVINWLNRIEDRRVYLE